MTPLFFAVLTASLLGSLHCAGMCGGFLLFAVGTPTHSAHDSPIPRWRLHAAYHLGRLLTYLAIGAAAGLLGAALDLGAAAVAGVALPRAAAMLAGATMILFGLAALLRSAGVAIPRPPIPAILIHTAQAAHRHAAGSPPILRASIVGLSTTLLPCGWLYAFAATAAGTGAPGTGALTMLAFWFGTLPLMASLGAGLAALTGPLRRRLPLVTSLLIVLVGLATLAGRARLPIHPAPSTPAVASRPPSLSTTDLPCCQP